MQRTATRFRLGRLRAADSPRRARARPMSGYVSGWGTMLVALAGLLAAPLAGAQLPLLALTTALAVGAGAEAHVRLHSRFGPVGRRLFDGFAIGPALTVLAA